MKTMNRIYSLLVLLLVGSTSALADGDDPFGDYNPSAYQGNMIITGKVVMNETVITDALVAVYCEDVLRGKQAVGTGSPTDYVFLQVYGNNTGAKQNLYFKVYTGGHIYTYRPDPEIEWKYDGIVGKISSPYIIDITPVSLTDDDDNSATLTAWKDKTCDVALSGRTFYKDGGWNTLCLPFSLSEAQIAASDLAGATIMELDATGTYDTDKQTGFDASSGTLYLYFKTATSIEASRPYIVKWTEGSDIANPVFPSVTVTSIEAGTVEAKNSGFGTVQFIGTYSPASLTPNDKSNLFIGESGTLYYPNAANNADGQYYVKSCRAYFHVDLEGSAGVRTFVLGFSDDATGISSLSPESEETKAFPWENKNGDFWYSLDGMKLDGKPTAKGIYIKRGKKNVVK